MTQAGKKFSELVKPDKRLGATYDKYRYDIPLNKDEGTKFLTLLIALMTFLAFGALATYLALGDMTEQWSSGLENKLTIEIPAEKTDGNLRTQETIDEYKNEIDKALNDFEFVVDHEVLERQDVTSLLSPWLGDDAVLEEFPLPVLISVTLRENTAENLRSLQQMLEKINLNIRIDTHEEWFADLLGIISALQFFALAVLIVIGITTLTAITGGIRSQIAIHKKDIELLHLMGAPDEYIVRQFQRHALVLAAIGSVMGLILGFALLYGLGSMAGSLEGSLLPKITLSWTEIPTLMATSLCVCIIALFTARMTVYRSLANFP